MTAPERTAIVTGGGSGIGLAISERLAADGCAVAIFDRDGAAAEATAAKITAGGGHAVGVRADVTQRPEIDAGVERVRRELGAATVLVNSAGLDGFDPFPRHQPRHVEPHPRGQPHGHVQLLPGDRAGHDRGRVGPNRQHLVVGRPGRPAADDPLRGGQGRRDRLHQGARPRARPPRDHGQHHPAGIHRHAHAAAAEARGSLGPGVDAAIATTPVRRIGRPDDIAAACAFLVRDEAGYVTGQVIGVNGGRNT